MEWNCGGPMAESTLSAIRRCWGRWCDDEAPSQPLGFPTKRVPYERNFGVSFLRLWLEEYGIRLTIYMGIILNESIRVDICIQLRSLSKANELYEKNILSRGAWRDKDIYGQITYLDMWLEPLFFMKKKDFFEIILPSTCCLVWQYDMPLTLVWNYPQLP